MENSLTSKEKKILVKGDDLTKINIFSYGVGHFMNDLCASCWFFFLSYYLANIIKIGRSNAGYVLLAGQLADALATPTVGILSDKTNTRLGKRTPWYIAGSILVSITFTLLFIKVIPDDSSETMVLMYYITMGALGNIGWAAVQVSHMALLPQISLNKKHKDMMNRIRTGFTFLAQTMTLIFSFLFFWLVNDKIVQYEILVLCCVGLGLFTTILFLLLCREMTLAKNIPYYLEIMRTSLQAHHNGVNYTNKEDGVVVDDTNNNNSNDEDLRKNIDNENPFAPDSARRSVNQGSSVNSKVEVISWTYWLKKPDFYAYMLVYMFVRLSINITQSVIPFYMEYVLEFKKTADGGTPVEISIVLLISTIGSILNSVYLQSAIEKNITNPRRNRLIMITIASVFVIIGCVPMFFLTAEFRYPIYGLSFFFGIGFSQGLSTVSNLINDVVGSKGAQGAFVYGAYSFADKLSCGLVLAVIIPIADNVQVLKYSMPIFPPASLLCAFVIVYFRGKCKQNKEKKDKENYDKLDDGEKMKPKDLKKSFIDDSRFSFVTHTNNKSGLGSAKSPQFGNENTLDKSITKDM
jgi:Na+/melibiose symporter-like transporter